MSGPRPSSSTSSTCSASAISPAPAASPRALADDGFAVTVVTGGTPVPGFPGPGVATMSRCRRSPPADAGLFRTRPTSTAIRSTTPSRRSRRDLLLGSACRESGPTSSSSRPIPFGRRQMRFELLPLLEAIAAMKPKPLLVTSVRDILQERAKPGRNEETVDILNRHFDLVLVHGDPAFAALDDTFPLASSITAEIAYTGLVAAAAAQPSPERFDVVVSAGGGAAGKLLVGASVAAGARQAGWPAMVPDHRPQPAAGRFRRTRPRKHRRISTSSASARISRAARRRRSFPSRKPATIRSATCCRPAAAPSSCRSPPAARPSRRSAPSGCSGWGWRRASPRRSCRRHARRAIERQLAHRSRLACARSGRARSRRRSAATWRMRIVANGAATALGRTSPSPIRYCHSTAHTVPISMKRVYFFIGSVPEKRSSARSASRCEGLDRVARS